MIRAIVTLGGLGFSPKAPGTVGSAAAIPLAWLLHWAGGFPLFAVATILVTITGYWATREYIKDQSVSDDPSEVIIDEVAGQWIALWPLSLGMMYSDSAAHVFPYPGWIAAFALFRLFDILKPGPVGWADRQHGAFGVMADDVIAGIFAALIATLLAGFAHGWFG